MEKWPILYRMFFHGPAACRRGRSRLRSPLRQERQRVALPERGAEGLEAFQQERRGLALPPLPHESLAQRARRLADAPVPRRTAATPDGERLPQHGFTFLRPAPRRYDLAEHRVRACQREMTRRIGLPQRVQSFAQQLFRSLVPALLVSQRTGPLS